MKFLFVILSEAKNLAASGTDARFFVALVNARAPQNDRRIDHG